MSSNTLTNSTVSKKKRSPNKLPDDVIIIEEPPKITIQTEDLGKKFEMAICILYGIPFEGKYKYSMEEAEQLSKRLTLLVDAFPHKIRHTAKNGSQYDFTGAEDESIKLSAKTTKKDGKVCPQVIGQPSRKKFCNFFSIDESIDLTAIKAHIESNVDDMLEIYFDHTFDCPIVYYNQNKNILQLVKLKKNIDWSDYLIDFSHKKKNSIWNESSTISINNVTIGEFQVHNHRDCIKFRWAFENLLKQFTESFEIISL
jgi:hypothetical protein